MEFIIQGEDKNDQPKEGFYVNIRTMLGDADHYETFDIGPFPKSNEAFLAEAITVLDNMKKIAGWNAEQYYEIPNFRAWFTEEAEDVEEDDPRYAFRFEGDCNYGFSGGSRTLWGWPHYEDTIYSLEYYNIHYIDGNGKKHKVQIRK